MSTRNLFTAIVVALALVLCSEQLATAQIQIGGPNGLVIGGGRGFRAGGPNGVQFGGGEGARFGPRGYGAQFGGGFGARFGPGVQVGGYRSYSYVPSSTPNYYYPGIASAAPAGSGSGPVSPQPSMTAPAPVRSAQESSVSTAPEMIVLELPATARRSLNYTINGTPFQLAPGNRIQMQAGLNWEIGLPGKRGQKNSFNLVKPGVYPVQQTEKGWIVDGEPVSASTDRPALAPTPAEESILQQTPAEEESILAPKPSVEPESKPVKPADKPAVEQAAFDEEIKQQPRAPEAKSVLDFNDKK